MAQVSAEQVWTALLNGTDALSAQNGYSQVDKKTFKDKMSAMQLYILRKKYGDDIANAAQSYIGNPDSLSARNTFFQALRANDATKAGATAMIGNNGSTGTVINSALAATELADLGNLGTLLAEEQDRNNRGVYFSGPGNNGLGVMTMKSNNSGNGQVTNVGSAVGYNLIPGLMGSTGNSNDGGSLRTLKKV